MFMCVVHRKSVNKLDLTWKQSFLIRILTNVLVYSGMILIRDVKISKYIAPAFPLDKFTKNNKTFDHS
jgi:hypothetical protein